MKRRSIFSVMMAAGLVLGSAASTLMLGSSSALADNDRMSKNELQRWREYCSRYRHPVICRNYNPNVNNRGWYSNAPERGRLEAGTFIPVRSYRRQRIVLKRWQRYPLQLVTSRPITNYRNRTIIPYGSIIDGALIPWNGGYRYQSYRVRFPDGRSEGLAAYSPYLDSYDRFDRYNSESYNLSPEALLLLISFLGGKSYTPSASVLGGLFDQHDTVRRDLAVVYPNQDLDLRLANDFVLD